MALENPAFVLLLLAGVISEFGSSAALASERTVSQTISAAVLERQALLAFRFMICAGTTYRC